MKNSVWRLIYHWLVVHLYGIKSFRGGWLLTSYYIDDYKKHNVGYLQIIKTHLKGWCYFDWAAIGVTDETKDKYLKTRDYHSMHPFNGQYSFYIDDKLTLKYILSGTVCSHNMPDYYYCIELDGSISPLMDLPFDIRDRYNDIEGILVLCKLKRALALKLTKGAIGKGFYKLEYNEGKFVLNGAEISEAETKEILKSLRGYLITELLYPHPEIAKYCDKSVGCLRYTLGKKMNGEWTIVSSFMRFGTNKSNAVENYGRGGVLVYPDNDGYYDGGFILDLDTWVSSRITHHPDNQIALKGKLPLWNEIRQISKQLTNILSQNCYLGIDYCITRDNQIKIIEINSQTGLEAMQLDKSVFETQASSFFKERLSKVKK